MQTFTLRRRLLASSTLCGAALMALAAIPARAAEAPAANAEVSEIVVTGSRIPQPNLTSVSPIQVVTAQEIRLQGRMDTIDLINNLPQNFQNAAVDFSGTSNPLSSPGGVSTADLRGLGPQRTLVLVDGRRLGIGDANTGNPNPAPDLNQIPAPLVDRVEVLTGGASATYGSDAVAGVVNFVMKRNFQGMQIDAQFGVNQHSQNNENGVQDLLRAGGYRVPKDTVWDGRSRDVSLIMGTNGDDGKINLTGYIVYHQQDPVSMSARDFAACQIRVHSGTTPFCNGSPNSNQFFQQTGNGPGINNTTGFAVVGNQFIDYALAPTNVSPPLLFNSNPYEYLQHDDTRVSAGFFADYEVTPNAKAYAEFFYMNDKSVTAVAPSGLFQGGGPSPLAGYLVNCVNPLMSTQQRNTLCSAEDIAANASVDLLWGRRNIEGGPRSSSYEHNNYRAVFGVRGEIPRFEGWKYDVYAQYYYTNLFQGNENYLSNQRIANALQVVSVNGTPTCIAKVTGQDPNCVPYNIFTEGGVTPAQVAYLNSRGTSSGTVGEAILEGNVTGDLGHYGVKSPWADDPLGFSVGVQHRRQDFNYTPDQAELSNDLSGFGGASTEVHASLSVTELYGETRIPLIQKRPYAEDLFFEGGYRWSHYSTGVDANTYKVGLQWAPISDIRFRASYNRAIRAPNILELFNPQSVTNTSEVSVDPCAPTPTGPATATLQQCMNTGVTAAQYGNGGSTNKIIQCPSGQCAVLNGGNPDLRPEKADTYTVGFTVRPSFLPGFLGSLDWYSIHLEDVINKIPLAFSLNQCLTTGDPTFCKNVVRSPSGILFGTSVAGGGFINGTAVNVASQKVEGIDLQATYDLPLEKIGVPEGYGELQFNFIGSALIRNENTPTPGAHTYDCAGLFGPTCQTVNPNWRHTLRTSWKTPWDVLVSAQWRYIGSTDLELNTDDPTLGNGAHDSFDAKLRAVSYLDLAVIWDIRKWMQVRAGVNNILDTDPQIINSSIVGTGLPNAYPTYDFLGRQIFVGFTSRF